MPLDPATLSLDHARAITSLEDVLAGLVTMAEDAAAYARRAPAGALPEEVASLIMRAHGAARRARDLVRPLAEVAVKSPAWQADVRKGWPSYTVGEEDEDRMVLTPEVLLPDAVRDPDVRAATLADGTRIVPEGAWPVDLPDDEPADPMLPVDVAAEGGA